MTIAIGLWIIAINAISVIAAYSYGRSNRLHNSKPKTVFCGLEFEDTDGSIRSCIRIYGQCKSGLCDKHCKSQGCNCFKAISAEEQAMLDEVRKL